MRLVWIAEREFSGRIVQIYALCPRHAAELLRRRRGPNPAHPTRYERISRKEADRHLRWLGYGGAHAEGCDFCAIE